MLREFSCAAFKISDQPRPPITVHMELNTVLGSVWGETSSIDESTGLENTEPTCWRLPRLSTSVKSSLT